MNSKPQRFRSDKLIQAGLLWRILRPSLRYFANQEIPYVVALDGKTGNTLWSVALDKIKVMSVTAHAGKIVVVGRDEKSSSPAQKDATYHLLNLDSKSGKQNWHFQQKIAEDAAHDMSLFKPEISKEKILIPFRLGSNEKTEVVALDANDGQVKWRVNRPWGFDVRQAGITIWDNQSAVLKITDTEVLLQKYDALTGKKIWEVPIEKTPKWAKFPLQLGMLYLLRSTNQEILVLNNKTNSLYIYDWETGNLKSKRSKFYTLGWKNLILDNQRIYHETGHLLPASDLNAGKGMWTTDLQASDLNTGKGIWTTDLKQSQCGISDDAAVVAQGLLVACSHSLPEAERKKSGHVFSRWLALFDLKTGQHKWSQELQNPLGSFELSVAGSSDMLFTCRGQKPKELIALAQTDGHIVWRNSSIVCDSYIAPVVDADRVVVLAQKPRWKTWFSFIPF
jgi:outer membrane protein assembly factor BamB